jgi:hypothetical protein
MPLSKSLPRDPPPPTPPHHALTRAEGGEKATATKLSFTKLKRPLG